MQKRRQAMIAEWLIYVADELTKSFKKDIKVREKSSAIDLVTEMDQWAEKYLVNQIRQHFPEDKIIGEEGCGDKVSSTAGTIWIIDPIDGTLNFVKAKNNFAIMIAIFEDGEPVEGYIYDVMKQHLYKGIVGEGAYLNDDPLETYDYTALNESIIIGNVMNFIDNRYNMQRLARAAMGTRSFGSSALQSISVINGEASLYFSAGLEPWDFAAPYAIAKSLGIKITDHTGAKLSILKKSPVLLAYPNVHQEALILLDQTK